MRQAPEEQSVLQTGRNVCRFIAEGVREGKKSRSIIFRPYGPNCLRAVSYKNEARDDVIFPLSDKGIGSHRKINPNLWDMQIQILESKSIEVMGLFYYQDLEFRNYIPNFVIS